MAVFPMAKGTRNYAAAADLTAFMVQYGLFLSIGLSEKKLMLK